MLSGFSLAEGVDSAIAAKAGCIVGMPAPLSSIMDSSSNEVLSWSEGHKAINGLKDTAGCAMRWC